MKVKVSQSKTKGKKQKKGGETIEAFRSNRSIYKKDDG